MSLSELIFVALVYGSPVFLVARIIQIVVLRKHSLTWMQILITLLLVQLVSLFLMLMIVKYWPFKFDVMYSIIAWPALFTEVLLSALGYLCLIKLMKK
jgi:hypothetical protein